jgi:four helix bundle protein
MTTIRDVEDLEAWRKARILVREIYSMSGAGLFGRDFVLRDQIRKASISILSNISEGFERNGTREFLQFLSVAKGSAGEVKSQLTIALDQKYISPDEFRKAFQSLNEIGSLIGGLMRYLRSTQIKGAKYKQK